MKSAFFSLLVTVFLLHSANNHADNLNLPDLGNSTSSIVSLQQEYQLGQYWLKAFRQQATLAEDPILYTYLHDLIQRLAFYSALQEKYFDLVVINSKSFNAFAVPGHVIGINSGLFLYAQSEDQLASVIAHELAHLSQRHYARSLDRQRRTNMMTLAGLLGSLLIIAAGGGDAGMAALTATQAAAIDNQLKYSRIHEQEADRVGMQTLAASGMNPAATAHMFQHLLVLTRYRTDLRDFEFLMTHPMADNRVSDALNQAQQYAKKLDQDSFAFHLMKARVYLLHSKNPALAVEYFRQQMEKAKFPKALQYGLALAYLEQGKMADAATIIDVLYKDAPQQTAFQLAKIQLLVQQDKVEQAITLAEQHLALAPANYALSMQLANIYSRHNQPQDAVRVLRALAAKRWPDTPDIWYDLAEMEGLAGNIAEVHLARSEYFVRVGAFIQAQRHLTLAKPLLKDNLQATSKIEVRMQEIEEMKNNNPFK